MTLEEVRVEMESEIVAILSSLLGSQVVGTLEIPTLMGFVDCPSLPHGRSDLVVGAAGVVAGRIAQSLQGRHGRVYVKVEVVDYCTVLYDYTVSFWVVEDLCISPVCPFQD